MRARLTASFVVLSVLLLFGALWIRSYNEYTQLRTHESRELRGDATTLALLVEQRQQLGEPVDRAFLAGVVDSTDRLEYDAGDGEPVVVEGKAYDEDHPDDAIETTVDAGGGTLTVTPGGVRAQRARRPRQGLAGLPGPVGRPGRSLGRLRDRPVVVGSVPPARRRRRPAGPRPVRPRPAAHPHPGGEGDQPGAAHLGRPAPGAARLGAGVRRARLARAAHPSHRPPARAGGAGPARRPTRRRRGSPRPARSAGSTPWTPSPATWSRWRVAARWWPVPRSRCATWPPSAPRPGRTRSPSRTGSSPPRSRASIETTYTPGPGRAHPRPAPRRRPQARPGPGPDGLRRRRGGPPLDRHLVRGRP